jgi:hypothetical protein
MTTILSQRLCELLKEILVRDMDCFHCAGQASLSHRPKGVPVGSSAHGHPPLNPGQRYRSLFLRIVPAVGQSPHQSHGCTAAKPFKYKIKGPRSRHCNRPAAEPPAAGRLYIATVQNDTVSPSRDGPAALAADAGRRVTVQPRQSSDSAIPPGRPAGRA